ncbi:carbon-monoxide dehydrogenase large subunit [Dictyobacter vulcani]|uniref:Carbon-monoxide dehydrogenase large subunit n=1 Tax=Dictyobacter vulcani TaxID=2607529 RepID=A0A5J4KT43_9CHLR|nr:xanthine dehydrogenase family protein molybdopterin-binding subunit [Dictyobacter vulcani]GER90332.1 carbon-monoxide dehydrogenase large subunit [Dictyobacter vulcani]
MSDLIGASLPRPDALNKVTGAACYPADLVRPGMLHVQVVFAHRPHARILSMNTVAALQYPGVVAVLTAKDVPYNAFGLIDADQPVLCQDVVRFEGDKVALVVAETKDAARIAATLVVVEYEDLPLVTDPQAALASGAPLVHEQRGTNLLCHFPLRKGDIAQAFAEADAVVEDTFTTTWQEHAFLQPEAGIAFVDEQGRLVLETAGQWLHEDRRQLAQMLQVPESQVVMRYAAIGGAFGGREDLSMQHVLALAAWKLQRPVALVWSREESMIGHHKRHPVIIQCRWAGKRDGTITAVEASMVADGGAYASTSVEVIKDVALFATGCYEIANLAIDGYAVYTNNIPSGAFRGFGAPQAHFACEQMVERLARALDLDPDTVRLQNIYREGSLEPTQQPLPAGVSALPVLERCLQEARTRWQYGESTQQTAGHLKQGIGIACGIKNVGYSFGFPEQATATVEVYGQADLERAVVRIGAADVGQGSHLILRQIAAETLKLPLDKVTMICTDSSEAPNAGSASASRMTFMGGRAVNDAAQKARENWSYTDDYQAQATVQYRAPGTTVVDPVTYSGIPNYCYGYAAQAVKVEVNTLTGQVQVLGIISVHDVGKAINLQQVTGQIEGCLAQALGYSLLENFLIEKGRVLTPYFSTYLLPTVLDMPEEIIPIVLELADPHGPYGARGVAEMALVPFAPAVASAIHHATGINLNQLPMTPERVLTALHQQTENSQH